jgi:putative membrane protein
MGLALMGFGFVVARFGLFLREIAMTTHDLPLQSTGASLWMGTGLLLGVMVNVAASINHVRLIGRLNRGDKLGQPSASAIAVALTRMPGTGVGRLPRADKVAGAPAKLILHSRKSCQSAGTKCCSVCYEGAVAFQGDISLRKK